MSVEFWIYMEQIEPASLGLLYKLQSMKEGREAVVAAVLPENCDPSPVFSSGAQKVYRLLGRGDERQIAEQIVTLCRDYMPEVMIFLATVSCRNIAAMVAAELETGLSADCTDIALRSDNILVQTRPTFGGVLLADIICMKRRPQIATVRPGIFFAGQTFPSGKGVIVDVPESGIEAFTCLLDTINTGLQPLSTARIVISGGKGIASVEGMNDLQKLAMLTGAAVGASRAAVSAGYAPYGWQVGLTGQIIRPDVYVAFGISGAVQHLVGMEGAKIVIAVNSDRDAPIFQYADIGIVSDWKPILQRLVEIIEHRVQA